MLVMSYQLKEVKRDSRFPVRTLDIPHPEHEAVLGNRDGAEDDSHPARPLPWPRFLPVN